MTNPATAADTTADTTADTAPPSQGDRLWVDEADRLDAMLAPASDAILTALQLAPTDVVVDIGCGTGALTRSIQESVAEHGSVTGVDLSEAMIEAARVQSDPDVRWVVGDAATIGLEAKFNVAASRFGLMFFEDPIAGFSNVRRHIRQSGRLVASVWRDVGVNEWATLPASVAARHVGPLPQSELRAFSMADADVLRSTADIAGFIDIEIEPLDFEAKIGSAPADVIDFLNRSPMGSILESLDPSLRSTVVSDLERELQDRTTSDGVMVRAGAWLLTAHRRGQRS